MFTVITTPTDSRVRVIRKIVEDQGLQDKVEFVDARQDKAIDIMAKVKGALPGTIVDVENNRLVEIKELFG